jgi:hypothetical protein
MSDRFMLMEHTKDNFVVTIWSDGMVRVESKYKVRTNIVHLFPQEMFDCHIEMDMGILPMYAIDMVLGVIGEYIDWATACKENA